jgi:3-oxoacyl-[acyl-carrier-protein] synthase II
MKKRRVVITGLGIIAPNGFGKEAFWKALEEGTSGIKKIERFDSSPFPTRIAGEVNGFQPEAYIQPKQVRRMDRTAHFAVAAAKMAVTDANLTIADGDRERTGVIIGTTMAGLGWTLEEYDEVYLKKGPMKINTYSAITSFPDASASQISIELGVYGPSLSIATACSSSSDTIGYSCSFIRQGTADMMITGGTDAPLFPPIFGSFCVLRALSRMNDEPEKASRPFDKLRDGFVLSEGAAVLVLEELDHALRRNAHIYAEILGFGVTCDAFHMAAPEPSGKQAARALRFALDDAHIQPQEIDYINAHGTSTRLNDKAETRVIKEVFGQYASEIPISSTKSMIGHSIAAAGAAELAASILAIEKGIIHPTINYEHPDPDCDLDYVPNKAYRREVRTVLKNSFGFGGKNSGIVIRKFEG